MSNPNDAGAGASQAASRSVPDRIEWHEGMLLSPQHFQQASARADALIAWHTLAAAPFCWGLRTLRIDTGLLPAGKLRVLQLDAVMPDGTSVAFSADNPLHGSLELDLAPFAEALANGGIDIYLTLPVRRSMGDRGAAARFRSVAGALVDDEVSEAAPADIPRLVPNLGLVAGAAPSALYDYFRLCTALKDNEIVKLGPELAPLIEVPKDGPLWERVSAFAGQLRGKAAFVAKQTAVPSSRTEDRLAYLELKERLRNLLTGLPSLEAVLRTPRLHPYSLYLALCALLGPLSMLKPGGLPPVPLDYDHANPLLPMNQLLESLDDALSEVSQDYREHKFEFRHGAFEIVLQPEWVGSRLVVGLRGQAERDLAIWMAGAIVGSQSVYASLRERRVLGAPRQSIDVAEDLGVRTGAGYALFAVQTSPELTLPGEALIVSNSNETATTQRPQEMILFVKG